MQVTASLGELAIFVSGRTTEIWWPPEVQLITCQLCCVTIIAAPCTTAACPSVLMVSDLYTVSFIIYLSCGVTERCNIWGFARCVMRCGPDLATCTALEYHCSLDEFKLV